MERFLESGGERTRSRLQALNQARFEIVRMTWLEDRTAAAEIVFAIEQRQPGFVPELPAAHGRYRWVYGIFGFSAAERFAACRLSGTAA